MKTVIAPGCEQVLNGAKLGSNHRWPLGGLQLLALAHWLSTYLYGLLLVSQCHQERCVLFSSTFTIIYCALLEVHVLVFDRADSLL